jgi:hypothetical protein
MTRLANRWTALCAWTALMAVLWTLFVPTGLSAASVIVLALTGPLFLFVGSALWKAHEPTPSVGQTRAEVDAADARAGNRR